MFSKNYNHFHFYINGAIMIKRFSIIIIITISLIGLIAARWYGSALFFIIALVVFGISIFSYVIVTSCPHCGATRRINPFAKEFYCQRCGKRIELD